jgi:hypothetical protein
LIGFSVAIGNENQLDDISSNGPPTGYPSQKFAQNKLQWPQ